MLLNLHIVISKKLYILNASVTENKISVSIISRVDSDVV